MARQQRSPSAPVGRIGKTGLKAEKQSIKRGCMNPVSKQKRKAGRPAKVIKKEIRASIRFTRPEYFIIKEKAAKAGLNAAAYIRQVAIHANVNARLTEEDRHFVRQLVGLANNINQLTKAAHQEGLISVIRYFESYRIQIDALLKRLQDGQ
jgi:hypothetical protein